MFRFVVICFGFDSRFYLLYAVVDDGKEEEKGEGKEKEEDEEENEEEKEEGMAPSRSGTGDHDGEGYNQVFDVMNGTLSHLTCMEIKFCSEISSISSDCYAVWTLPLAQLILPRPWFDIFSVHIFSSSLSQCLLPFSFTFAHFHLWPYWLC